MEHRPTDPYARLRRRRRVVTVGILAAATAAGWYLWPGRTEPRGFGESIDAIVLEAMENGPISGVSVGVARGGRTIHARGYGWADLENRLPAAEETVYKVGSITKQFTAAAIMQLVEDGRVSLDAPITEYLQEFPEHDQEISIRALLNHTAGVRNFTTMERWWSIVGVEMTPEEMVGVFAGEPLDFEPGTAFSYSNSGYILLGVLVERVNGQPYGGYLNEHLFVPLDLPDTSYCDDRALVRNRARGYQLEDGDFANATHVSMSQAYAAGGICSNVGDLLRWLRLLSSGGVVRRQSYEQMVDPATLPGGQRIEYGFGLAGAFVEEHRRIAHLGGMMGFSSYLAYYPDDDLRIVVLTNTEGAASADLESRIARLLLGLAEQATRDIPLSPDELAGYTGVYDMKLTQVTLTTRDGRLYAVIDDPGIDDVELIYQGDQTFQAEGDPQTWIRFEVLEDSAVGFVLTHQGITLEGRRVTPPAP